MHSNKNAFTLIELLVVVLIIGILAAIALPQYYKAVRRSRASEAITMLNAILKGQEEYFLIHGEYTDNIEDLSITVPPQKLEKNMFGKDRGSNYSYYCFDKRTCAAIIGNFDHPTFEFHTDVHSASTVKGKRWCQLSGEKNQNARDICELMGTVDPAFGGGNYYLLK
ncbi:MAG: prepilin-type N-terminal cleavage/methylation domain-containing protein [Elusimicrobiota bacterium]|jgi:prepilin-type N-terminal cleavage/methylation domain-containing protein|nr:prepilin-type N-terminal cleavage/methylation domain-containing protein [Elusimicrobiota bacterium]